MNSLKPFFLQFGPGIFCGLVIVSGAFLLPWKYVDWGRVEMSPSRVVTVTGEAKSEENSQIATFNAGVYMVKDNKDEAIAEVEKKIGVIIDAAKAFGVNADDIKTQNLSVNQSEEQYYEEGRQKYRPGQWRVSNNVEVKLRDAAQAGKLAEVLAKSGANNVYGPNFGFDDTKDAENALLSGAIADARKKAELIARGAGKKLGSLIQVVESYSGGPVYYESMGGRGGGGGLSVEPGSGTVRKSVTATWELK